MFKVVNLRTEYTERPLGMDCGKPRFSWELSSDKRGCMQRAYEIQVTERRADGSVNCVAWESGRVESAGRFGISYGGEALEPETAYSWKVTVWDQDGEQAVEESVFETGLMDPQPAGPAWEGATWIGGGKEDLVYFPHYLSVFRASYALTIPEGSTKAGFVFGANDSRLMGRYRNLFEVENERDESYLCLETDLSGLEAGGKAMLHIYRVGYHPDDRADVPFRSLELEGLTEENCHAEHTYYIHAEYGIFDFFLDGTEEENQLNHVDPDDPRPARFRSAGINLNPVGHGNNFISYPMVADLGVRIPAGQKAVISHITVQNFRKPYTALYENGAFVRRDLLAEEAGAPFELLENGGNGVLMDGGADGYFQVADTSKNAVPMLRTVFTAEKKVAQARLYITARGVYEAYMNGSRIGDDWFNPGLTQYNRTHMYQAYDVTANVAQGENAIGVMLGEGWWSGAITFTGANWNFFGDRSSLLAKLVITYVDGSRQVVATRPESWRLCTEGPIRYGSFFQGEVQDNRLAERITGWATPEYDEAGKDTAPVAWKQAVEVLLLPDNTYMGTEVHHTPFGDEVEHFEYDKCRMIGQVGPCVKTSEVLAAQSVSEVRPGVFLYDMGQNLAGVPRIHISGGKAGQCVTLRFGEITYPDMEEYKGQEGMLMLENIRAALAQDKFILKGGDEVLQPHFTFHGYQYLEITGIEEALPLEAVEGIAISSVPQLSASYSCSNEEVNKLWSNVSWSLRDNYISIPTDCPQRNERMGWSGDLSVFSRAAVYMADSAGFLSRHMMALRDTQAENGRFADIAPLGGGFGGVLWGSVGVTAPWEDYLQYGDREMLAEQYPAMKQYMAFLDTRIDPKTGMLDEGPLGDWLGPEYSNNEPAFLWSVYHAYDLWILWQSALVLGEGEDAAYFEKKYEERKAFFNRVFVDPDTHCTTFSSEEAVLANRNAPMMAPAASPMPEKLASGRFKMDTQTSYAVPLALGIFAEEYVEDAVRHLADACGRENFDNDNVKRPPYSLMTGFIGTAWISQALSAHGRDAEAYRLLQAGEYPSWIYSVRQGATTIWERLNSYTKENGFGGNNSMNSFNHYSFGAVAAWMCMYSLGIKREQEAPGFTHFTLCPTPDPDRLMTWAKGWCDTVSGRIESCWEATGEGVKYTVEIPAGTSAEIRLIGGADAVILESGRDVQESVGVTVLGVKDGRSCMRVGSGRYEFLVKERA